METLPAEYAHHVALLALHLGLTSRQAEVVVLIINGAKRRQVAQRLGVEVAAVHSLMKRINHRLGLPITGPHHKDRRAALLAVARPILEGERIVPPKRGTPKTVYTMPELPTFCPTCGTPPPWARAARAAFAEGEEVKCTNLKCNTWFLLGDASTRPISEP